MGKGFIHSASCNASFSPFQKAFRAVSKPFIKSRWEGAQTTMFAVLSNDLTSGSYYADCKEAPANPLAQDEALCERFWQLTEQDISTASASSS